VKKNNLIISVFVALIVTSAVADAGEKYPAADFQPEVVYQDKDLINKHNSSAIAPVAVKSTNQEAVPAKSDNADSKYPAADFKPQVLFHDENYVPDKASPSSSQSAENLASEKSVTSKSGDTTTTYLIGLFVLAGIGFFLFKNQGKCKSESTKKTSKSYSVHPGGLTGVAKYVNRVSGTGVSRYIEKNVKGASSAKTGVAKYVAKQVISKKAKASEVATGVEKYMRNRG
jgi:hypothetical protein